MLLYNIRYKFSNSQSAIFWFITKYLQHSTLKTWVAEKKIDVSFSFLDRRESHKIEIIHVHNSSCSLNFFYSCLSDRKFVTEHSLAWVAAKFKNFPLNEAQTFDFFQVKVQSLESANWDEIWQTISWLRQSFSNVSSHRNVVSLILKLNLKPFFERIRQLIIPNF